MSLRESRRSAKAGHTVWLNAGRAAKEALQALEGVEAVESPSPSDLALYVARVRLKASKMPDVEKWREQYAKAFLGEQYKKEDYERAAHQRYMVRGIEVMVNGHAEVIDGALTLRISGDAGVVILAPLENRIHYYPPIEEGLAGALAQELACCLNEKRHRGLK